MSYKLKPCPFCGGDAEVMKVDETMVSHRTYYTYCTYCWAKNNKWSLTESEAIKAWNRRV